MLVSLNTIFSIIHRGFRIFVSLFTLDKFYLYPSRYRWYRRTEVVMRDSWKVELIFDTCLNYLFNYIKWYVPITNTLNLANIITKPKKKHFLYNLAPHSRWHMWHVLIVTSNTTRTCIIFLVRFSILFARYIKLLFGKSLPRKDFG